MGRRLREGLLIVLVAAAVYLLVALLSYSPQDPGWSYTGSDRPVANLGGRVGAWLADVLLYLFGYMAYMTPIAVAYGGWLLLRGGDGAAGATGRGLLGLRWLGMVLLLAAGAGLATLHFLGAGLPESAGGVLGALVGRSVMASLSLVGATLVLLALFLAGLTLLTGLSWLGVTDLVGCYVLRGGELVRVGLRQLSGRLGRGIARAQPRAAAREATVAEAADAAPQPEAPRRRKARAKSGKQRGKPSPAPPVGEEAPQRERQMPLFDPSRDQDGLPPMTLLDEPRHAESGNSEAELETLSRQVEAKLADFGVEVEVSAVHPGPVITRFELQPAAGIKVSKVSNLAKDLARALSVVSVRIVEVIPGKSTIGLEIPNRQREVVFLSEVLQSPAYRKAASPVTLALGKDIGGQPQVADLTKMPHLLIAGTTGSGKSVAVNAMLLSMLYKARPDEVRLILIDPKMLELNIYEGIPHLLAPVVTDMKEAANALRWSVAEMERRYKLMSALGVRNIAGFNRKVREAIDRGEPIRDPLFEPGEQRDPESTVPTLEPLPFVVIVVDEFADMMMVVGKKVEELIARLAQKARAAGIHLVLATQRPSVDVITGLIKANIPARVAFQVSSKVDSRTILDQTGAEQLLGYGDMLYLPAGTGFPARLHGAFVADHEVHNVAEYLRGQGAPSYLSEVLEEPVGGNGGIPGLEPAETEAESDPLYDEAVAIVTRDRKASISYVQRKLKIGYNRAARMIEDMEAAGVVSPVQGNGAREVLAPEPP